jgi:hypothetical protein
MKKGFFAAIVAVVIQLVASVAAFAETIQLLK